MKVNVSIFAALALSACARLPVVEDVLPPRTILPSANIELGADGRCFAAQRTADPVFETVTEQVEVVPPVRDANGTIITPGVFREEPRARVATPAQQSRFETPCPQVLTEEFTASLQRALAVRGLYDGPITGVYDQRTGTAVRSFQDINSPILSIEAGRRLGLIPLSAAQLEELSTPTND